jgi:hypothetical protein
MGETLRDTALQLGSTVTTYKIEAIYYLLGLCAVAILIYVLTDFGALRSGRLAAVI